MGDIIGRLHSVQSLGAVDGPGLRYVVFLQGCPLRCAYCHNPDTWDPTGGKAVTVEALTQQIRRCRSYLLPQGGVTVSGGEPLAQPAFVAALFRQLQAEGYHTALDTSGAGSAAAAAQVLPHTSLVICDLKFPDEARFGRYCRGALAQTLAFLDQTAAAGVPVWLRQVIVPGLNDTADDVRALCRMARRWPNVQKIELLAFRRLCVEKYARLGIPFPLADTPECPPEVIVSLEKIIKNDS